MIKDRLKLFYSILSNIFTKNKIILVTESADWVIKDICQNISLQLNNQYPKTGFGSTYSTLFLRNKIIHFGSINTIFDGDLIRSLHPSNKAVVTWFHVVDNDPRLKFVSKINDLISFIHTSCIITQQKLIQAGFSKEKVVLIPIGIDLSIFKPSEQDKKIIKKQLNLPLDKIIIGSFQKDGKGWGDGNEAKLEKGPDFFCDVIEKLSQKYSVHVLLTGPARGYVKKRLEKSGVSFTHRYLKDYKEIVKYYHALDLYLIASRQEGGPKALLECMACKVPFVSTAVGMAPDIIQDNHNGLLVNIEDLTSMVEKASRIIDNKKFADSLVDRSVKDVQYYEWKIIAEKYYDLIYKNIL